MFFKRENDNNIDNNDKNAINIENVENNNNNNKKEKRKFKDSINKKYLKNGSYSSVMIVVFIAIIIVINMIVGNLPSSIRSWISAPRNFTPSVMRQKLC